LWLKAGTYVPVTFFQGVLKMKKVLLAVMVAALAAGAASAQVTISGGFALSYCNAEVELDGTKMASVEGDIGVGGNIFIDYLLPISIPLSLGVEAGVDASTIKYGSSEMTGSVIPILARAAYHFDIDPKLDLFLVGKIGYILGSLKSDSYTEEGFNGVGFGIDLGVAYYFTNNFGIFAEGGFDGYMLGKDVSESYDDGMGGTIKQELKYNVPFYRFLTAGLSVKF
jgi:hypothetical protein